VRTIGEDVVELVAGHAAVPGSVRIIAPVGLIPASESNRRTPSVRTRSLLSRTLSRGRRLQYQSFLRVAVSQGYAVVPLGRFLDEPAARESERVMILRHDVDQRPVSALESAGVERELGIASTWYFRWRTADPEVIAAVRAQGGEVGLHYETLTRRVLRDGLPEGDDTGPLLEACRDELRDEIRAFRRLFGRTDTIAAHGDTRVGAVRNLDLVDGPGPEAFGVRHDANLSLRAHRLGVWLTDRSAAEGGWAAGEDPHDLLARGVSPILCLTHPNNWVSGPALWRDRMLTAALPARRHGRPARVRRALPDAPPPAEER
jgi:hypothetical protein